MNHCERVKPESKLSHLVPRGHSQNVPADGGGKEDGGLKINGGVGNFLPIDDFQQKNILFHPGKIKSK